jgi:hypothetical protein
MLATTSVAETNVVVRFAPFQRTTELPLNPVPLTVRLKAGPPVGATLGLRPVVVGTPLLMDTVCAFETPPPGDGLLTVTEMVPVVAISAVDIVARNWFEETYVVGRLAPFHRTTEPEMKLFPLTVNVNAGPPPMTTFGETLVVAGSGFDATVAFTTDPDANPLMNDSAPSWSPLKYKNDVLMGTPSAVKVLPV